MAFIRPTLKQLQERVQSDLTSRLGVSTPLSRSFIKALSWAIAGVSHVIHGHLDWVTKQIIPDTADAEYVERWANIYGLEKIPATYAERDATVTGVNGTVIPAGTIFVRSDGVQYATESEVTIASGTGTVHLISEEAGATGNIDNGGSVSLLNPISGLQSTATIISSNSVSGIDEETTEALLIRLLDYVQEPPNGGSENDYIQWAKEVAGVTRAWVYPARMGLGTVGVSFVTDNEPSIIPDNTKVQEVQDYIDERRPVTAEVTVFAPTEDEVDFDIQISPNTQAVRDAITAELEDLFTRESEPEGTILISHVREAISIAAGEADHVLVDPTTNIVASTGQIKTVGNITFGGIP